jgi:hypothetical protein
MVTICLMEADGVDTAQFITASFSQDVASDPNPGWHYLARMRRFQQTRVERPVDARHRVVHYICALSVARRAVPGYNLPIDFVRIGISAA